MNHKELSIEIAGLESKLGATRKLLYLLKRDICRKGVSKKQLYKKIETLELKVEKMGVDIKKAKKKMYMLLDEVITESVLFFAKKVFLLSVLALIFIKFLTMMNNIPLPFLGLITGMLGGSLFGILVGFKGLLHLFWRRKKLKESIRSHNIVLAPGIKISRVIGVLFTKKIKERVFDQIIADMQLEYFEAFDKKLKWEARWIHYRGIFYVLMVAVTRLPLFLFDIIIKIKKIG